MVQRWAKCRAGTPPHFRSAPELLVLRLVLRRIPVSSYGFSLGCRACANRTSDR
jgi:hypothetical protein